MATSKTDRPGLARAILSKSTGEPTAEEESESTDDVALESAAEDILAAIHDRDVAAFVSAWKNLKELS